MINLNSFAAFSIVVVLLATGCGKEKTSVNESQPSYKKIAHIGNDLPLIKEETENLLDDSDISDFAFLDDDSAPKSVSHELVAQADIPVFAENDNFEIDDATNSDVDASDNSSSQFAFRTLQFDLNKNVIRNDQQLALAEDIETANEAVKQGKDVIIKGHSCQIGSASYNLPLSQRRAEAVKNEMVKEGIAPEHIKTLGYGYESPLVWSDAKSKTQLVKELAPNRRAEIVVN